MTEYQFDNIVALLEDFLHSGSIVLDQLKSHNKINNQNSKDIPVLNNEAQIPTDVSIQNETRMVLEDDLVDLIGFEEVPKEKMFSSQELEPMALNKIGSPTFKNAIASENEAHTSTKCKENKETENKADIMPEQTKQTSNGDVELKIDPEDLQISQDRLNIRIDCTECELQFQDDTTLNKHFRINHKNVTIRCNHCEFTTTQPSSLNFHRSSQHKTSCNQCDYTTLFIGDLNSHVIRKHKKIKCEKCNYKSPNMSSLRSHDRSMHEGIKVYCDECNYKCVMLSTLRVHKQSKHENIYYKCNMCAHKASRKDNLNTHIKAKHNK